MGTKGLFLFCFFILIMMLDSTHSQAQSFDIEGHRGCRGLMPENSIPGFLKALELGVTTLEMDVVVSGDEQIVVSHDPLISPEICYNELGHDIPKDQKINMYLMDYEDIKLFDCGSKENSKFPEQAKLATYKPLLKEVLKRAEQYADSLGRTPVFYNIEIKCDEKTDNIYHPAPEYFTDLVFNTINGLVPWERVTIQSFDPRVLQFFKIKHPEVRLSFLVSNSKSPQKNIETLSFNPSVYSPYYKLISAKEVESLHEQGIKVIPWTVNEIKDMQKMVGMGVDGLISDYPNRYFENFKK